MKRCARIANTKNSALAEHDYNSIDWDNSKIIGKENHWLKRKGKQALMIDKTEQAIANRDNGRSLPDI